MGDRKPQGIFNPQSGLVVTGHADLEPQVISNSQHSGDSESSDGEKRVYLGCLTKGQLMCCVATGLLALLVVIAVPALLLIKDDSSSITFPTGGDMLDFLVQSGEISQRDGLLATWYHRANNKSEMTKALESDVMILEADVNVDPRLPEPIPIMAHPPAITSDNTLDQWLDAVLASRKGIKLDFKSLESVGPSLDQLRKKNQTVGINRPVWLNADILLGPNVPGFMPVVNATGFFLLIEQTFPDVTVSPGWLVTYSPPFIATYTRSMVEDMYETVKNVSQKVTFPVHALLARSGWEHISWLLRQSPRFSLTLWQGKTHHPTVEDMLFVRDNSNPARVYYDIYEPTLSAFKMAAGQTGRVRRFYPGGDLMDYFQPTQHRTLTSESMDRFSLDVRWFPLTEREYLLLQMKGSGDAMLVVNVVSDSSRPEVPLIHVRNTNDPLSLQELVEVVDGADRGSWGLYLRFQTHDVLRASLRLLHAAYSQGALFRPVWVGFNAQDSSPSSCEAFVSSVEELFPHVTLVLPWSVVVHRHQSSLLERTSQRVALRLRTDSPPGEGEELDALRDTMDRYDLIVEDVRLDVILDGASVDSVMGHPHTESRNTVNSVMGHPHTESRNTSLYRFSDWTF